MKTDNTSKEVHIFPSDIESGINKPGMWQLCVDIANAYNERQSLIEEIQMLKDSNRDLEETLKDLGYLVKAKSSPYR